MSTGFAPTTERSTSKQSLITADDLYLFNEGTHHELWRKLGAHVVRDGDAVGTYFAVWAPNAREVSVIGDFNGWDQTHSRLTPRGSSGIWEGYFPDVQAGASYKYHIVSRASAYQVDKADPLAFREAPGGGRASMVWELDYNWQDSDWMASRGGRNQLSSPISIYEVHLGSWRRVAGENNRSLSYRELAFDSAEHVKRLGFTHVEFMPVMEHP